MWRVRQRVGHPRGAPAVGVDITASSRLPATRRHQTCSTGEVFPWIFPRLFPLFRVSFPVSTVFLAGRGGAFFASFSRCTCLWAESIRRPRTATSSPPLPAPPHSFPPCLSFPSNLPGALRKNTPGPSPEGPHAACHTHCAGGRIVPHFWAWKIIRARGIDYAV